jgi:hypothetical protein
MRLYIDLATFGFFTILGGLAISAALIRPKLGRPLKIDPE